MKILILTEANLSNHVYNKWTLKVKGINKAHIEDKHTYNFIIDCTSSDGLEILDVRNNRIRILEHTEDIDDFICNTKDLTLEDTLQLTKIKSTLCLIININAISAKDCVKS